MTARKNRKLLTDSSLTFGNHNVDVVAGSFLVGMLCFAFKEMAKSTIGDNAHGANRLKR